MCNHSRMRAAPNTSPKMSLTKSLHAAPLSPSNNLTSIFAIVAILLAFAWLYRKKATSKNKVLRRLPPGPAGLPVIGNMHQMLWNKPVFRWIDNLLKEMHTDILCLRSGPVHFVAVSSPEIAREFLRKNDAAFASRPATFASGLFSFGYRISSLSPHGEQWKKMKRVLTSCILSPAMERRMHGRRAEEADHLVGYVYSQYCSDQAATTNNIVDVRHVTRSFCGNVIRRMVFGRRHFGYGEPPASSSVVGGPGPDEVEHVAALFTLLNSLYSFCISDCVPALVGLNLDGHEKIAKGVLRTINRLHDPIIQERVHEWSALRGRGEKKEITDFLDALVSLEDAQRRPLLSFEEIKAQTLEIMFATVDNPSNAVEWALAEMMNKPEIMQRAIDELDRVVGKHRPVEESDITHLNYLKACIREAFRIHPYHAFNVPHVAMEDTTVAGYLIPKGSQVILSRIGLGRNPNVWDDPLQFRPERHLINDSTIVLTEPDLRFISFGTGRRACPGVSLGTSITMMLFARLLQGFTWTNLPGVSRIELRESIASLELAKPLLLQAQPRLPLHVYQQVSSSVN